MNLVFTSHPMQMCWAQRKVFLSFLTSLFIYLVGMATPRSRQIWMLTTPRPRKLLRGNVYSSCIDVWLEMRRCCDLLCRWKVKIWLQRRWQTVDSLEKAAKAKHENLWQTWPRRRLASWDSRLLRQATAPKANNWMKWCAQFAVRLEREDAAVVMEQARCL